VRKFSHNFYGGTYISILHFFTETCARLYSEAAFCSGVDNTSKFMLLYQMFDQESFAQYLSFTQYWCNQDLEFCCSLMESSDFFSFFQIVSHLDIIKLFV